MGRVIRISAACAGIVMLAGPIAQAEGSTNDLVEQATIVEALPFDVAPNIAGGTLSEGEDTRCLTWAPMTADASPIPLVPRWVSTVWYSYTASVDQVIAGHFTDIPGEATGIGVYRQGASGLELLACGYEGVDWSGALDRVAITARTGETYLFQLLADRRSTRTRAFGMSAAPVVDVSVEGLVLEADVDRITGLTRPDRSVIRATLGRSGSIDAERARVVVSACNTSRGECEILDRAELDVDADGATLEVGWDHATCTGPYAIRVELVHHYEVDPNPRNDGRSVAKNFIQGNLVTTC